MPTDRRASDGPPRVAVIAVHGVADQQPGQTATAIANLLANIDDGGTPAYGPFTATSLRVPVRAMAFPDRAEHMRLEWAERSAQKRDEMRASAGRGHVDGGIDFMASLLARYEPRGPDETYDTTVLQGERRDGPAGSARRVDIYEMYWADLSRLTRSWVRIFAEVYQLLIHMGSLGVHAVRAAQASEDHPAIAGARSWRRWAWAQRTAANILAHHIVVMNLCLAGLLIVLLSTLPSDKASRVTLWIAYIAGSFVLASVLAYRRYAHSERVVGLVVSVLAAAAVIGVVLWWIDWRDDVPRLALATLFAVGVASAIVFIVRRYARHRPDAPKALLVVGGAVLAWLLVEIWWLPQGSEPRVQAAVLHSAEYLYAALRVAFGVFLVLALIAHRAGRSTVRAVEKSKADVASADETRNAVDRLKRLNWTARLTLALPAVLFLLGTTVVWSAVWAILAPRLGNLQQPHRLTWLTHNVVVPDLEASETVHDFVDTLIVQGSGLGFGVMMVFLLLAGAVALYALAPSVLLEVLAPRAPKDGTRSGRWLDAGYRLLRWPGRFIVFGVLAILPLGALAEFIATLLPQTQVTQEWLAWIAGWNRTLLLTGAAILAPAGAGLVLFGNRLKQVTLGFRNFVDVLLDVDNYLREHPRDANPRARIATRLASLLRHVYAQDYAAVVIIAHSQGTVITTDLLRFVHQTGVDRSDAGLACRGRTPILLFTMGSPLRQLYGLRFPHLYRWARHHVAGPWTDPAEAIDATTGPNPAELGVQRWVNAYRSADYVGRYLWRPERCDFQYRTSDIANHYPWTAGPFDAIASQSATLAGATSADRREFCIGAGAHTHYWDGTAPQVALELDALISGGEPSSN